MRPAGQEIVEMDQGDEITITADTEIRAIYETAGSDPETVVIRIKTVMTRIKKVLRKQEITAPLP